MKTIYRVNPQVPLYLEHRVADIISRQKRNGWDFDTPKAREYVQWLENEQSRTERTIREYLALEPVRANSVSRPFKKDGSYSKNAEAYQEILGDAISGPFTGIKWQDVNIASRQKIAKRLMDHGWTPSSYTEKGSPQVTIDGKPCPNLENMDNEFGQSIAHWYNCNHRKGVIQGWVNTVSDDGKIYYPVNSCGTNTRRMRHSIVVNVPKAEDKVFFGKEMRSLFIARDPYDLVGTDISGLENKIIAHYMIMVCGATDEEVNDLIDPEVDFHSKFLEAVSDFIETRSNVKNLEYAFFFGAQDPKLGEMVDMVPRSLKNAKRERIGQEIRRRIGNRFPSLNNLLDYVDQHVKTHRFLVSPDGGKLWPRGDHSAFNTLVQGTGQVVFKVALSRLDKRLTEEELDSWFVGNFHDESQCQVHKDHVQQHQELSEESIVQAGKFLRLRVPMHGESKVGKSWAMTH